MSPAPQPITLGVPFAKGSLADIQRLELTDEDGRPVPLQTAPLARWSDGSIQWLLLDFIVPGARKGLAAWQLRSVPAERSTGMATAALRVTESSETVMVDTGVAVFHLNRTTLQPFSQVLRNGKDVLDPTLSQIVLTDARGRPAVAQVERVVVEGSGPVRATIRWEGQFASRAPCRFVARLCCFAGTALVRLRFTLHNPRRARHPGGLWDLGDPGSIFFREMAVELGLVGSACPHWVAEIGQPPSTGSGNLEIYQDSSGGNNWQSPNHVNRHGRVPCAFRGYRVRAEGREAFGLRASPIVTAHGPTGSITAAVPEFWQQFPKALEVQANRLRVGLFPGQFKDLFELQGGEQKTHTVWFHFGLADQEPLTCLDWVHEPVRVQVPPEWYAATRAVAHFLPALANPDSELERLLAQAASGPTGLVSRREIIDEFGWRNYGEVYADHEEVYYDGPKPVVSHYNNQYDVVYGSLLQYYRTGDPAWFDVLVPLARHVIDIDIYHTKEDKAAYNGGLFWFTDHYKSAATCSHRTYSRLNCQAGDRSYGGGPSSNHLFSSGLLYYYYLTGDPQARAAVLSLADWVLAMDEGTNNLLGLVDPEPTGLASMTGQMDFHGPGRGAGNSINALLDAWLLTGQRGYLDKAEALIRRSVHPADDIVALDLLNVEKRWSYTVFFSTLARYLDLKAEANERDFGYAYARASLVHYARWMVEHEIPYFDQADQLEYPTEAWATQEFRKANVLRLAAAHTEEPLRSQLLQRANELARRGWQDLLRFETRSTARALAVVMIEGSRDAYFQHCSLEPAPAPTESYDFGQPIKFVPQKQRVVAQLRSVGGLARAIARLANPVNWWNVLLRRESVNLPCEPC